MNMINVDTIEYFKSAIAKPINPLQRRFYMDALLALEKQIAIEARWEGEPMGIKNLNLDNLYCPSCDYILKEDYRYCPDCGQKLQWKEGK